MGLVVTTERKQPGIYVLSPVGSIDTETHTILSKEIFSVLSDSTKAIMFNMENVTYISSMGLNVIFKTKKKLESNKGELILINVPSQIRKVLDIVASLPSMTVFESIQEADSYLMLIQQREMDKKKLS